jgi:signal transduction histidine kinase
MRSLFAKVLGWFVLTLFVTAAATISVSVLAYNSYSARHAPFSTLLGLGLADARQSFETGGRESLRQSMEQFQQVTGASMVALTDPDGVDLLTGELHPRMIRRARSFSRLPFLRHGEIAFNRYSTDGKYCFFFVLSPQVLLQVGVQPLHVFVLAGALLLCYALTYWLIAPLRSLRLAMENFGQGKLDARANQNRSDELGDLARAFNRMAERIQTLLGAERRLLLDISHELRSPLARLSVAVELARSGNGKALPLDRIQKEADRLNELISQMLQVTRLESQGPTKMEPLRLDELVRDIVNDCSIEASSHGCAVLFPTPGELAVPGDPELLRRAIENVLRNAIRYAPQQSKIEVDVENGGGAARVRVRDYGPGVPEQALAHMFDPFFRVEEDRSRARGGVGLGLSIAKRAVDLHRGTITARNLYPGLIVEITLPS